MNLSELPAPGWKKKKRLLLQTTGIAKPPPRAPSHLNTQVRDPGYKKIKAICSRLKNALGGEEDDFAVAKFVTHTETFISSAGKPLLERMQTNKKLVDIVLEELKVVQRHLCTVLSDTNAEHIFQLFPKTSKERNYECYYLRMKEVADRVNGKAIRLQVR